MMMKIPGTDIYVFLREFEDIKNLEGVVLGHFRRNLFWVPNCRNNLFCYPRKIQSTLFLTFFGHYKSFVTNFNQFEYYSYWHFFFLAAESNAPWENSQ